MARSHRSHAQPTLGMQCTRYLNNRNNPDWWQKHEQKWRGAPIQHGVKDVETIIIDEFATCVAQVVLLLGKDLRDWGRLRHELRSV